MSSLPIAHILQSERPLLDGMFGEGEYQIESADPDAASIRSSKFVLLFEYDRGRAGDVMAYLSAGGPASEPVHSLETWARFLGEEILPRPADKTGRITFSVAQQVRDILTTAARLDREIFSNDQKARDAASFSDGYLRAYNDWASGKGPWQSSD